MGALICSDLTALFSFSGACASGAPGGALDNSVCGVAVPAISTAERDVLVTPLDMAWEGAWDETDDWFEGAVMTGVDDEEASKVPAVDSVRKGVDATVGEAGLRCVDDRDCSVWSATLRLPKKERRRLVVANDVVDLLGCMPVGDDSDWLIAAVGVMTRVSSRLLWLAEGVPAREPGRDPAREFDRDTLNGDDQPLFLGGTATAASASGS